MGWVWSYTQPAGALCLVSDLERPRPWGAAHLRRGPGHGELLTYRVLWLLPRTVTQFALQPCVPMGWLWRERSSIPSYFLHSSFLLSLWVCKLLNSLSRNYFLTKLNIIHFSCLKSQTLKKYPWKKVTWIEFWKNSWKQSQKNTKMRDLGKNSWQIWWLVGYCHFILTSPFCLQYMHRALLRG